MARESRTADRHEARGGCGRFPDDEVDALRDAHDIGIRSGREHAYTDVWVVVVEDRAFIRSWNLEPTGWFRSFQQEPRGSLRLGDREIPIRGVMTRRQELLDAVTAAYANKYSAPESQRWVVGLAERWRVQATLELVPADTR